MNNVLHIFYHSKNWKKQNYWNQHWFLENTNSFYSNLARRKEKKKAEKCQLPIYGRKEGTTTDSITWWYWLMGFPVGSDGKESTSYTGDLASIPGLGRSQGGGHGNHLQYSCLENCHGQKSLLGCSPWGHKELDTTEPLSSVHSTLVCHEASLVAQMVKNLPTVWETGVQSLGQEYPLGKGMANHTRILA